MHENKRKILKNCLNVKLTINIDQYGYKKDFPANASFAPAWPS